jgi:hypothetical protein
MFQYATARALAIKHDTHLLADSRAFGIYRLHSYLIDRFNTVMSEATNGNLNGLVLPPSKRSAFSSLWALRNRGRLKYFRERGLEYHPEFESLGANTYLHGYWQSEKYFRHIAPLLRCELTRPEPVDEVNREFLDEIGSVMSVSLHIRRGDYVSNPKTSKVHGTCSLEYYLKAAKYVADRVNEPPTFFVFSDDPEWTRENLKLPFPMRFVSHNLIADPSSDLRLMSACKHHVIANSSFSWWGAWLNPAPDKIVVACRRWFADRAMNDHDLVPEEWIRVDATPSEVCGGSRARRKSNRSSSLQTSQLRSS